MAISIARASQLIGANEQSIKNIIAKAKSGTGELVPDLGREFNTAFDEDGLLIDNAIPYWNAQSEMSPAKWVTVSGEQIGLSSAKKLGLQLIYTPSNTKCVNLGRLDDQPSSGIAYNHYALPPFLIAKWNIFNTGGASMVSQGQLTVNFPMNSNYFAQWVNKLDGTETNNSVKIGVRFKTSGGVIMPTTGIIVPSGNTNDTTNSILWSRSYTSDEVIEDFSWEMIFEFVQDIDSGERIQAELILQEANRPISSWIVVPITLNGVWENRASMITEVINVTPTVRFSMLIRNKDESAFVVASSSPYTITEARVQKDIPTQIVLAFSVDELQTESLDVSSVTIGARRENDLSLAPIPTITINGSAGTTLVSGVTFTQGDPLTEYKDLPLQIRSSTIGDEVAYFILSANITLGNYISQIDYPIKLTYYNI